jgi:hypothetical protein
MMYVMAVSTNPYWCRTYLEHCLPEDPQDDCDEDFVILDGLDQEDKAEQAHDDIGANDDLFPIDLFDEDIWSRHCCTDGGQTDGLDYAAGDGVDPVFVAHLVDHVICGSVVQIGPRFRETEDYRDLQELRFTE